jgi:hypothetical protein
MIMGMPVRVGVVAHLEQPPLSLRRCETASVEASLRADVTCELRLDTVEKTIRGHSTPRKGKADAYFGREISL